MDKSCANHPESMALATCKACDKSVCLMCVVDEKEGTFCSSDCHTAFANGQEVPKFAGVAAASTAGVQKIDSIFDDEPAAAAPQAELEEVTAPPSDEPMPIVAEGTKWRPIGAQCENHTDTPAVANCDRCGKPVCALCLLEAAQGTFCSADCMSTVAQQPAAQPAPAERAALARAPVYKFRKAPVASTRRNQSNKGVIVAGVVLLLVAGAAGGYYGWNGFAMHPDPTPNPNPDIDTTRLPDKPDPTKIGNTPDPKKPDPKLPDPKKPDPKKPDPKKPDPPVDPTPVYYPPIKPKVVKAVASQTRALNPWAEQDPGTWYRLRTTRGSQVTYTDVGLKEKGKDFYVLATQTSSNGQDSPVSESRSSIPTVYLRGEESFSYEGQPFLCEIRSPGLEEGAAKTWALLAGKNQGAVLKSVSAEGTFTAKRVWEHTMRVKNTPLECLVIEGQIQNGASSRSVKVWHCGTNPLGVVMKEADGESIALIDLGSDWTKRPAFPK